MGDIAGVIEVTYLLRSKEKRVPHPTEFAEQAAPHTVAGYDASVPPISTESIVFAAFPPDDLLFNDFMA
jgi:hypothetical protein